MRILNEGFRLFLTFNATSWMWVVYVIKGSQSFCGLSIWVSGIAYFLVPILLSSVSLFFAKKFGQDELNGMIEFSLADNDFLPTYLGYFFVSLSVPSLVSMIFVYMIVFLFTHLSQTQYFNPIFLMFGYHYYHVSTEQGTKVFIISKGKVIRNKRDFHFDNLKRINDTTYIEVKEK